MTTAPKRPAPPPYYTHRQSASLDIAKAIVQAAGYEILDHGDGEVAANIARRSVEIVDAVAKAAQ